MIVFTINVREGNPFIYWKADSKHYTQFLLTSLSVAKFSTSMESSQSHLKGQKSASLSESELNEHQLQSLKLTTSCFIRDIKAVCISITSEALCNTVSTITLEITRVAGSQLWKDSEITVEMSPHSNPYSVYFLRSSDGRRQHPRWLKYYLLLLVTQSTLLH